MKVTDVVFTISERMKSDFFPTIYGWLIRSDAGASLKRDVPHRNAKIHFYVTRNLEFVIRN